MGRKMCSKKQCQAELNHTMSSVAQSDPVPTCPDQQLKKGVVYGDKVLTVHLNVPDVNACCSLCAKTNECFYFSFSKDAGYQATCRLSKEGAQGYQATDSVSGRSQRAPAPIPTQNGWPTFTSLAALQADSWGKYYKKVYGSLPTSFPVNTVDMWMVYDVEIVQAGIANAPKTVGTCPEANPPLGQRYNVNNLYSPSFISWLWHPYPYQKLAANSWQEVLHEADPWGDEHFGAWFVYAPGSGIYFHLGNTIAFQEHLGAFKHFNVTGGDLNEEMCKAASSQGYNSVQFLAHVDHSNYQCDTQNSGRAGLVYMGVEIVAVENVGTYACTTEQGAPSTIKAGWQASRACVCDNRQQYLNCQGISNVASRSHDNASHLIV